MKEEFQNSCSSCGYPKEAGHSKDCSVNSKGAESEDRGKETLLAKNLQILFDIWLLDKKDGKYDGLKSYADRLEGVIQGNYDRTKGVVNEPYDFLRRLREKKSEILADVRGSEKESAVRELCDKLDMPTLELPKLQ